METWKRASEDGLKKVAPLNSKDPYGGGNGPGGSSFQLNMPGCQRYRDGSYHHGPLDPLSPFHTSFATLASPRQTKGGGGGGGATPQAELYVCLSQFNKCMCVCV